MANTRRFSISTTATASKFFSVHAGGIRQRTHCNPIRTLASNRDCQNSDDSSSTNKSRTIKIPAGTTVQAAYDCGIQALQSANVVEPEASMPQLLAAALDLDWETGYRTVLQPQSLVQELTEDQASTLSKFLERRLNHEPIQYILGQWDFLDYVISIRPPLLCPRPETEELIQLVIQDASKQTRIKETGNVQLKVLDIGCGTGVIGISLADQLNDARVHAIDIEPIAMETSLENARRILTGSTVDRYQCSLIPVSEYVIGKEEEPYDMIVSNPPYIPTSDYNDLSPDVINFESRGALEAGEDGLIVILDILKGMKRWCKPGAPCWMEVDPTHPKILKELLSSSSEEVKDLGVEFVASYKDMFGKDRFVKLQYTGD
ncbi:MAG: hypothetical protein SGBAC_006173 [Bacillariaceae sp.]